MKLEEIKKLLGTDNVILKGVLEYALGTPEGLEALQNHAKTLVDKAKSDLTAEIYNNIDNDLFKTLGVRKKDNQKTYDFLTEIVAAYKTLKDNPTQATEKEVQDKIKDLETKLAEAVKKSGDSEDWHNKYLTALKEWEKKSEDYTKQIEDLNSKGLESLVAVDLEKGLAGLKFNPNVPAVFIDRIKESIKQDVLKTAKIEDGKVVYYNADGTPKINGLYKPVTAKEIYEAELKDVIVTTTGGGGADKGDTGKIITTGEGDSAKKRIELDPTKFSTKLEFSNHIEEQLLANGIEKNSDEWHNLTQTARTEYGVEKMNRV